MPHRTTSPLLAGCCSILLPALALAGTPTTPPPPPPPPATPGSPAVTPDASQQPAAPAAPRYDGDAYEAYENGAYNQALQAFVDQQVEQPDNPALMLNIGSAHYKMKSYEDAEKSFAAAALASDPALRAQALYNLGNCAFRTGRLDEAVARYQAALELNPNDQDAKFNIEFVRDEIRRRHEEAQKRQQQGEQQQQQGDQQQQQQQQGEQQQQQPAEGTDSDQDGLSDQTETTGANPTDPAKPDSDGDGLLDGQEDRNRNGRVDPGETDPNKADSDGDGTPDGQQQQQAEAQPQESGEEGELSREEAERYLQGLGDDRPKRKQRTPRGRRRRVDKDW